MTLAALRTGRARPCPSVEATGRAGSTAWRSIAPSGVSSAPDGTGPGPGRRRAADAAARNRGAAAGRADRAQGHLRHRTGRPPPARRCWRATARRSTPPWSPSSRQAGVVTLGKLNCDEFAMGSSNENSAFGPVRNPGTPPRAGRLVGRLGRCRGGAPGARATGTDTGGSIRQPAASCGITGISPPTARARATA